MSSGIYAACTGLVARTEALDTIANNLANASTAGYRATRNVFHSMLASAGDGALSVLNQDVNDYGVLSETRIDTKQGALEKTSNPLDVALEGTGYFAVQTKAGEVYTRSGSFQVSAKGQLITAAGDAVLGDNGPITVASQPIDIASDGTISVNGAVTGRIRIVEFDSSVQMQSVGGTYYSAKNGKAVPAKQTKASQGMLESSNVNTVESMMELIAAQREVEGMRRSLSMFSSEMDKTATHDIPRINS